MTAKLKWLKGIFPPLVTPFDKDERLDEKALRALVRFVMGKVNGFVTCGTTGEFPYLTPEENRRVVKVVADESEGKKPIIAGVSAPATHQVIELAEAAKKAGAQACLVCTPYFLHPGPKGIYRHFEDLAKRVDLPVIMYNIPQTVGAYLPVEVVEDLSEVPGIVGLKDTSGNLSYTLKVLEKVEGRIDVLVGNDEIAVPSMLSGCCGGILMSANVFPELWKKAYAAVQKGDVEEAMGVQRSVQKIVRIFGGHGAGLAVKAALNMVGVRVGTARRPLKIGGSLLHEVMAEIQLELEKLGKIKPAGGGPSAPGKSAGKTAGAAAKAAVSFTFPAGKMEERFEDIGITPEMVAGTPLRVGTGKQGKGVEQVQADVVSGPKDSGIGDVYAEQCTHPRHGFEALTGILEPNLMIRPSTLIVPTAALKNLRQANMVYGPGQAAVGKAIVDAALSGTIPGGALESDVVLVSLTVNPRALNHHTVYKNVYAAASEAIASAFRK